MSTLWLALLAPAQAAECDPGPHALWTRAVELGPAAAAHELRALVTVDLDEDGQHEAYGLLVPDDGVKASLALWGAATDERGPLSAAAPVPLDATPRASSVGWVQLFSGDADGDGHADLVLFDGRPPATLGLWVGHGDGGTSQLWLEPARTPTDALLADVDGDGAAEFVAVGAAGDQWILDLDGRSPDEQRSVVGPTRAVSTVLADVDGDGRPDLVTAGGTEGTVGWLAGLDPSRAETRRAKAKDVGALTAGDIDADGDDDVLYLDRAKGQVRWLQGASSPRVGPVVLDLGKAERLGRQTLTLAELNGDACLDLVIGDLADGGTQIAWGTGDGTFVPQRLDQGPGPVAVGDLDADGHLELLIGSRTEIVLLDATPQDATPEDATPSQAPGESP